jgi:uncharacterized LabA/DUF88 family protein
MASKQGNQNNYAFIDDQNLHISVKNQGWVIDYKRFRRYLTDKYQVTKASFFIGFIQTYNDLYKSLQECGFILIFKPILEIRGRIKGNVDEELVLQAMIGYPNYDKAVIISGDGDFFCLIKYLKSKGKLLKLMMPDGTRYSSLLRKFATDLVGVNKLKNKVSYKKEERHSRGTKPFG